MPQKFKISKINNALKKIMNKNIDRKINKILEFEVIEKNTRSLKVFQDVSKESPKTMIEKVTIDH